jgi:hypothetical protein
MVTGSSTRTLPCTIALRGQLPPPCGILKGRRPNIQAARQGRRSSRHRLDRNPAVQRSWHVLSLNLSNTKRAGSVHGTKQRLYRATRQSDGRMAVAAVVQQPTALQKVKDRMTFVGRVRSW